MVADADTIIEELNAQIGWLNSEIAELRRQLTSQETVKMNLENAAKSAENATRAKSGFLAKMSHEIRTPMNAIIGMAELALREDMPPAASEHVLTIKQAGANLLAIINDILDFSKIESGKMEIITADYLFSSLINDVVSIIRMRVVDARLQFVVNIDSNIPNALCGDEIRIRQIMLNILSNAVKYTDKGFVSLTVFGEPAGEGGVILTIEVIDTGKGIKEKDMGTLFGDFAQIDMANNKGIEGTGLGLAIARNLVVAMGGEITVDSTYGEGSTFTITLPQKVRDPQKIAAVEKPKDKNILVYEVREIFTDSIVCTIDNLGVRCAIALNDSDFYEKMRDGSFSSVIASAVLFENVRKICKRLNSNVEIILLTEFGEAIADQNISILPMPAHCISVANALNGVSDQYSYSAGTETVSRFIAPDARTLIVDDINTNLKVAEGLLLPYQMRVDTCKSGAEAIEAVREHHYDIIFMDHMMPEMDGIEATAHIRELGSEGTRFAAVPVIALTANAVSGMKEMFLRNGFNGFLSKPIDTVKLNTVLETWLPKEKRKKATDAGSGSIVRGSDAIIDIEIQGVNTRKGIAMTGGNVKNYLQTLDIFRKDGLEKIREIKTCLETDNLLLYATHTHALKSAAASIGAADLSESAKALETAGKREDMVYIRSHNAAFLLELEALVNNIGAVLSAEKNQAGKSPEDPQALKTELARLKTALDTFDSSAIDEAAARLRELKQTAESGETIEQILENTLIGEYDEAAVLIDTLLEVQDGQTAY